MSCIAERHNFRGRKHAIVDLVPMRCLVLTALSSESLTQAAFYFHCSMQGFKIGSSNYPLSHLTQALDGWVDGVNLFKELGRKIKREEREKKERKRFRTRIHLMQEVAISIQRQGGKPLLYFKQASMLCRKKNLKRFSVFNHLFL